MDDFPCFEVLSVPVPPTSGAVPGEREPVVEGLTPRERSRGFRVERRHGRWWVLDLGSARGTRHNGALVRDAELSHGDVLEAANGVCRVIWFHDPRDDHHPGLEADVLANPDDEACFRVWADWRLERGLDAAPTATSVPSLRVLGHLASRVVDGWLDLDWWYGFPRRAVVRSPSFVRDGQGLAELLRQVIHHDAFRFLRHLELDPYSFGSGIARDRELTQALVVLGEREAGPWLETVRIGPVPPVELTEAQRAAFEAMRRRQKRVSTPVEHALIVATQATLEVLSAPLDVQVKPPVGRSRGLALGEPNFVGQLDECAVQLLGPRDDHPASQVALRLDREADRWFVEDIVARAAMARGTGGLSVNGRTTAWAHLRDGDLLSPVDGLTLRFRLR